MQTRCSRVASLRRVLLGATMLSSAACAGTPLPEPPDELPAPDFEDFARDSITPTSTPDRPSVLIGAAQPGSVQPGSRVWFINLDSEDLPIEVSANAQGGFVVPPIPAVPGERIRVISRTARQHSAPLDLEVAPAEALGLPPQIARASAPGLECLRVTPSPTLLLHGAQGALVLENGCPSALTFTRIALRFGDQGMTLSSQPSGLAAGARVRLTIRDTQGPAPAERLEIVLIDVEADDGTKSRVAVDVFSALE